MQMQRIKKGVAFATPPNHLTNCYTSQVGCKDAGGGLPYRLGRLSHVPVPHSSTHHYDD